MDASSSAKYFRGLSDSLVTIFSASSGAYRCEVVIKRFRNSLLIFNYLPFIYDGSGSRGALTFVSNFVNRFPHLLRAI